ncbi:MAG: PASTA domain-containing protein, partial [Chloroflexi bacterium]|nr:PASTA domain-containing protein [Chloroflexota bacterium]
TPTPPPPTPTPVPPTATPTPTAVVIPAHATPIAVPNNPNEVIVPSLIGLPEADAQRIITESGLMTTYVNYQTINEVPDRSYFLSIPPGAVLSQLPQPGTRVPRGTRVYIAVRKQ